VALDWLSLATGGLASLVLKEAWQLWRDHNKPKREFLQGQELEAIKQLKDKMESLRLAVHYVVGRQTLFQTIKDYERAIDEIYEARRQVIDCLQLKGHFIPKNVYKSTNKYLDDVRDYSSACKVYIALSNCNPSESNRSAAERAFLDTVPLMESVVVGYSDFCKEYQGWLKK